MDANRMGQLFNLGIEASRLSNKKFNDREIESFLNKAQKELIKERFARWKNRAGIGYGDNEVRDAELSGLLTGSNSIPRENYILGTADNGALYGPDLDNADQPEDQFGVFIPLPDECMYALTERAEVTKDGVVKHNTKVKKVTYEYYDNSIYNDHLKPYGNLIWSMDWGSYTTSTPNGSGGFNDSTKEFSDTGVNFNMSGQNYLSNPVEINTDRAIYAIPGKGWKITGYTIRYIKLPADIRIDMQTTSLQRNCQLADFMHEEVVDKAVKLAAAALVPDQGKYQVTDKEQIEDQ